MAMPDHDTAFAQAMQHGKVVLGFSVVATAAADAPAGQAASRARFVEAGQSAAPFVRGFGGAVGATPVLAAHAAGQGALTFLPDADGVVRRVPTLLRVGDRLVPTLVTEMLRTGQGQTNVLVRSAPDGVQQLRIGGLTLPTAGSGELWLHYAPPAPQRTISAWKLVEGLVPPAELAGRLLLVGASAQGLMDLRFGAHGQLVPGVEIHAQALEQILDGTTLWRPSWAQVLEALVLVLGGLAVGMLALKTGPAAASVATATVLGGLWAGAWWAFAEQRVLLDPLTPSLGIACAFMLPSLVRHHGTERRKRWIAAAFSRYVSPNLVAHIVEHPEQLTLGGQRLQCSFVFTDLADFTQLMERIDPAAAVHLLNQYLDGMIAVAFRHHGTLDRIVGDGIAIMFSAPLPQADHRARAVACAIELQRFATGFAQAQQAAGVAFGHTRIGVHSGEVIVGNFGGGAIFDYRALGDPVNTASRLEAANKWLGTRLCLSQDVLGDAPDLPLRCVGRLVFKGKSRPLKVFHPAHDGLDAPVDAAALSRYAEAYALMERRDPLALAAFQALALADPGEPLVRLHLARLQAGELGDILVLGKELDPLSPPRPSRSGPSTPPTRALRRPAAQPETTP
jgi:adenylate cyclase